MYHPVLYCIILYFLYFYICFLYETFTCIHNHFWRHGLGELLNISIFSSRTLEIPRFFKVFVSHQVVVRIVKDATTLAFSWECLVCYSYPTTELCYLLTIFVHQQCHNSRLNRDSVHLAIISPQSLLVLIVLWQRYFWNIPSLVKFSYLTASKE